MDRARSGDRPRRLNRRTLLAAFASSPILAACDTIETLARAAQFTPAVTPVPPTPVVRIGYPRIDYYYSFKTRLQTAARDMPADRRFAPDIQGISLAISTGDNDSLDIPPPMKDVPRVYAQRAKTSAFPADLLMADPTTIGALASNGVLQDLGPLLAREGWFQTSDFTGDVLRASTHSGKLVALPLEISVEMMWRNRPSWEMLGRKVPLSGLGWEQYLEIARRLTLGVGQRPAWGASITATTPSLWSLAWQQGAEIVSADGTRVSLTEGATQRVATFLGDLINRYRIAPPIDGVLPSEEAHLLARAYGLGQGGPGFARSFPANAASAGAFVGGTTWGRPMDAQLAALPTEGRGGSLGVAPLMLGIPRTAPDVRLSLNALRSYLDAGGTTMLTPTKKALSNLRTDAMNLNEEEAAALRTAVETARFLPGQLPLSVLPIVQREFVVPVLRNERTPDVAARLARPALEEILLRV